MKGQKNLLHSVALPAQHHRSYSAGLTHLQDAGSVDVCLSLYWIVILQIKAGNLEPHHTSLNHTTTQNTSQNHTSQNHTPTYHIFLNHNTTHHTSQNHTPTYHTSLKRTSLTCHGPCGNRRTKQAPATVDESAQRKPLLLFTENRNAAQTNSNRRSGAARRERQLDLLLLVDPCFGTLSQLHQSLPLWRRCHVHILAAYTLAHIGAWNFGLQLQGFLGLIPFASIIVREGCGFVACGMMVPGGSWFDA
ncbi:hypothetical protein E2C01_020065 [Portunus trituberculatus]|uniref:Uncharacterized protein n=1 Tax=Portunus trituberculatus TaxID=210409 RepID=A0A5B7E253_PORTR|nr:hypothetical protein [Portunus trituberculatus]